MFDLTLEKLAHAVGGKLVGGQDKLQPSGASIDTRTILPGQLFFALKGEKTDGHRHLNEAREKGACGAVVSSQPAGFSGDGFPLVMVKDVKKALQQAAVAMRQQFGGPVAAITGSTGKTTTKDMLSSILEERGRVLRNTGNYNNELGLPLTLLSLERDHWAIVLEMGMRGLGEIDFLACLGKPNYGIITNIGHTHQELLGSQARIAQAKAELLSHIPSSGGLCLNREDKLLLWPWLSNIRSRVLWAGSHPPADLYARDIKETATMGERAISFSLYTRRGKEGVVRLPLLGRHNVINALLAAGIAQQLGLSNEEIISGLAKTKLSSMRLEVSELTNLEITLINDAYNANPVSVNSALMVLASYCSRGRRAIAVLGDMYELGSYAKEGHLLVGRKAKEVDIAYLITVGELAYTIAQGAREAGMKESCIITCRDNQEALAQLRRILLPQDVVLIKGSRGVKMEEIVTGLLSC